MAETDKIIELGRKPGFFRSFFNAVYTLLVFKFYIKMMYKCIFTDLDPKVFHSEIQICS